MGRLWNDIKSSVNDQDKNTVLSMNQVKELQQILLVMLKDVDTICRSNGLHYVLIGGSAIGSIRHKGFIPWDDDVDIAMPRTDYEKFLTIINRNWKEKYKLTDAIRKNNYGKVIPKLRLKGTVYKTVLDVNPNDKQIKIDIFIIENTYNNKLAYWLQGFICMFMGFCLSCRRLAENKQYFSNYYKGKDFNIKTLIGRILSFASLDTWANWTERCYSMCKDDTSKFVTIPADGLHFFKGTIKREIICEVLDGDFEGCKLYLPKGYDFYLRRIYGDYMKIPPKEKQMLSTYTQLDYGKYKEYIHS